LKGGRGRWVETSKYHKINLGEDSCIENILLRNWKRVRGGDRN
jgi:hypothetical protein